MSLSRAAGFVHVRNLFGQWGFSPDRTFEPHHRCKGMSVSPLPMFLIATAALAVFALFVLVRMLRAPTPARRSLALRRRRIEEQIQWDRLHPPAGA